MRPASHQGIIKAKNRKRRVKCNKCNIWGHSSNVCYYRGKKKELFKDALGRYLSFKCGQPDHFSKDCNVKDISSEMNMLAISHG